MMHLKKPRLYLLVVMMMTMCYYTLNLPTKAKFMKVKN